MQVPQPLSHPGNVAYPFAQPFYSAPIPPPVRPHHEINLDPPYIQTKVGYSHSSGLQDGMDGDVEGDSDEENEHGDVTREEDGEGSRSQSTESKEGGERSSPRKKQRITLARGEACVACR